MKKVLQKFNSINKFDPIEYLLLFVMLLKYAYYNYCYYPIMDDNNMYGIFRLKSDIFKDVLLYYKMYTSRPLAAILDPYFWTKFWDSLGLALIIITILHFITCVLIYRISRESNIKAGLPSLLIFALMPLGSEATYWLSASSRVVVGMFFVMLSLHFLNDYLKTNHKKTLYLFIAIHLISLGFYEQVIVFSLLSLILFSIVNPSIIKNKKIVIPSFLNYCIITTWYATFSTSGNIVGRGQILQQNFIYHIKEIITGIKNVFMRYIIETYRIAIPKGLQIIMTDQSYIFFILILFASVLVFLISQRENFNTSTHNNITKILLGIILILSPFIPFFLIDLTWICARNLFISLLGLGLIVEAILNMLSKKRILVFARGLILSSLVFIFLIGNVYELFYYRDISITDSTITSKISNLLIPYTSTTSVILFNTHPAYIYSIAKRPENCTEADWALCGALRAKHPPAFSLKYALPVPNNKEVHIKENILPSSVLMGIDDNFNFFLLKTKRISEKLIYLYKDEDFFGTFEFTSNKSGIFTLNENISYFD